MHHGKENSRKEDEIMGVLSTVKKLFFSPLGSPVQGAVVYLETESGNVPVAFQVTGKSGGVTFAFLDKGIYRLVVSLPQQKDKFAREQNDLPEDFQIAYHSRKKIYFIPEPQGLFIIQFSEIKNTNDSRITPMHEPAKEDNNRIVIGKFEVDRKYGRVTLQIAAKKAKSFQKLISTYRHDADMSIIRKQELVN